MKNSIIKIGQVVSVDDETGSGRIKVALAQDVGTRFKDLSYAFPLAPKMFHSMPKVGECVLVFTVYPDNKDSQRYYIGPIISQYQDLNWAPYVGGSGSAISVIDSAVVGPRQSIDNFAITEGAFPEKQDIALIGRKGEDIILKENEVDIRCGARKNILENKEEPDCVGPIKFNSENPVYIQMKYFDTPPKGLPDVDGAINIVADKINLVSYEQSDIAGNPANLLTNTDGEKNSLIDDADMQELMMQLHTCTYADILIPILQKMCMAITNHVHNHGPEIPCKDEYIKAVDNLDLYSIQSKHVRIS